MQANRSTPRRGRLAHQRHHVDIPAEQLQLAYRHMARPGWPATLDAALLHPHYGGQLIDLARNLRRGAWRADPAIRHENPDATVPPTPQDVPLRAARNKRAAAL